MKVQSLNYKNRSDFAFAYFKHLQNLYSKRGRHSMVKLPSNTNRVASDYNWYKDLFSNKPTKRFEVINGIVILFEDRCYYPTTTIINGNYTIQEGRQFDPSLNRTKPFVINDNYNLSKGFEELRTNYAIFEENGRFCNITALNVVFLSMSYDEFLSIMREIPSNFTLNPDAHVKKCNTTITSSFVEIIQGQLINKALAYENQNQDEEIQF